jgi:hypothetical protein
MERGIIMIYRFIRTGDKPVNTLESEYIIRSCFEPCKPEVKKELDKFLSDLSRESIVFDFGDNQVEVRRKNNDL